jgi:hypothetical protein
LMESCGGTLGVYIFFTVFHTSSFPMFLKEFCLCPCCLPCLVLCLHFCLFCLFPVFVIVFIPALVFLVACKTRRRRRRSVLKETLPQQSVLQPPYGPLLLSSSFSLSLLCLVICCLGVVLLPSLFLVFALS